MKTLIIGGDAAGMSVASKLRRADPAAQVTVFERTLETSYGACGLPYYIGGVNNDADKIRIRKPDAFRASGIDLRLLQEVVHVDVAARTVTAVNLANGEQVTETYDDLVVASGASPVKPPIEGIGLSGVHTLKSIADAEKIRSEAEQPSVRDVVIVGAGYIGLELAESFVRLGKRVTILEMATRPMLVMDEDFTDLILDALARNGVCLKTSECVQAIRGENAAASVVTDHGEYPAQMVILSVGVRPNTGFLKDTGVALLKNGAVVVDDQMRSSVPHIYAAGDCATIRNLVTGKQVFLPLGTNANKQGKVLGEVLTGKNTYLDGVLGTSMCRIIDLEVARTGINEREAQEAGIPIKMMLSTILTPDTSVFHSACPRTIRQYIIADKFSRRNCAHRAFPLNRLRFYAMIGL